MAATRIQSTPTTTVYVAETRSRTAPREEGRSFGSALRTGAAVVLGGVEVGATVLGGPIAGAAVRGVRIGVSGEAGAPAGPLSDGTDREQSMLDQMRAMQEDSQSFNLQYLQLQEEIQQENRRFSTVSNVLKAKHETAKSAIANIRA